MLQNLSKTKDNNFNIKQAEYGIKGKIALENLGVPPTAFTTFGRQNIKQDDLNILEKKRYELEQKGLGIANQTAIEQYEKSIIKKPGQDLYEKLVKKYQKKGKGLKRVPKHIKKNVKRIRQIEDEFQEKKIPDNIMDAIKNMKL
jgi:UDP-galactopyranose mutase